MRNLSMELMAGSECECTSEMGRGQFSIFGAVEEKGGYGFWRIGREWELVVGMSPRGL